MPDYTVSGDVDSMLRSANDAAIRSAIGVGTTDAPTFLAQTLTGQSLTGTQATSLVDLSATWNTTGTPSALKLNVTDTASNAASNLMDLQVGGVSKLKVTKTGDTSLFFLRASSSIYAGVGVFAESYFTLGGYSQSTRLFQDDVGILAQRNGGTTNAFRLYNATDYNAAGNPTNFDRASLSFTSGNFRIATENSGTTGYNTARGIDFVTGGAIRMSISAAGFIGIGTTAPRTFLHLASGGANAGMEISGTSVPDFTGVGFVPNIGNNTTGRISQSSLTNGGLNVIGITANTNVVPAISFTGHLGSTSPTQPAVSFTSFKHNGSNGRVALADAEISSQWFNGTNALMTLLGVGNVGIGTTTPASKLQVTAGDIEVDTVTNGIILKAAGTSTRYRLTLNAGGTALVFTAV